MGGIIPFLATAVRRLHDSGRSGWYYFIYFIPLVGPITLIFWLSMDSQPFTNKWGPNPKEPIEEDEILKHLIP